MRNISKKRYLALLGVTVLFTFFAFGSFDDDDVTVTTDEDDNGEEAAAEDDGDAAQAAQIGDEIEMSDSIWTVHGAEDLGDHLEADSDFVDDETTDGRFIQVHFEVENTTNEEQSVINTPSVRDSEGRTFEDMDGHHSFIPEDGETMLMEGIGAGFSEEFYGIYEVTPDSEGIEFLVQEIDSFDPDQHPVELGL